MSILNKNLLLHVNYVQGNHNNALNDRKLQNH